MRAFAVWLAQGLGMGRLPMAPGTLGSVAGVGWTALLLATGSGGWYTAGTLAAVALSIWACGEAEHALRHKDPGSVVLDEIVAVPVCYAGWLAGHSVHHGGWLSPGDLFGGGGWMVTLAVFAAFRFFDILKPWPVRQSQRLPGGWGITADDLLAAIYVNVVLAPVWWLLPVRD